MNERNWNRHEHGKWHNENQYSNRKKSGRWKVVHTRIKMQRKWRWNKKKSKHEFSKKGSKEIAQYWCD